MYLLRKRWKRSPKAILFFYLKFSAVYIHIYVYTFFCPLVSDDWSSDIKRWWFVGKFGPIFVALCSCTRCSFNVNRNRTIVPIFIPLSILANRVSDDCIPIICLAGNGLRRSYTISTMYLSNARYATDAYAAADCVLWKNAVLHLFKKKGSPFAPNTSFSFSSSRFFSFFFLSFLLSPFTKRTWTRDTYTLQGTSLIILRNAAWEGKLCETPM